MKHVSKLVLLGCTLLLLFSCTTRVQTETPPTPADQAQVLADTLVTEYRVTSVQYALIDDGKIVLSGSSGVFNRESGHGVAAQDMYGIGSTSKMFTAAALMMLVDQGKVDLDASITTYLPTFTMADDRYPTITARMLLNHSSGIYGSTLANAFLFDDNRTLAHDNLLSQLATQRLKYTPGTLSEYCNDGFTLIEILVEQVSGIQYSDFIAQHISLPLGLSHTKTPRDDFDKANRIVRLYHPSYDGALPTETVNALGTGGVYSTAEDLCVFSQLLMGTKPQLLSKEAAEMMMGEEYAKGIWIEHTGDNFFAFGLGWDTVHGYPFGHHGLQALFKGGDTQLFHSALLALPSLKIAAAVTSSGGSSLLDYTIAARIVEEYLLSTGHIKHRPEPSPIVSPPVSAAMPSDYSAFSGLYGDGASMAKVHVEEGILHLRPFGSREESRYICIGDRLFQEEEGSTTILFSPQRDGNLYIQANRTFDFPNLGSVPFVAFIYQRLEDLELDPLLLYAWNDRAGKRYYPVNEVASAQSYLWLTPLALSDDLSSGYVLGGSRIIDANRAANTVVFRDVGDLEFKIIGEKEFLFMQDMVCIREDFIAPLTLDTTQIRISDDGYAQYLGIGEEVQDKTLVVTIPSGASFAVYDKNGVCITYSTVSGSNTSTLPEGGMVAFIAESGDTFDLVFR